VADEDLRDTLPGGELAGSTRWAPPPAESRQARWLRGRTPVLFENLPIRRIQAILLHVDHVQIARENDPPAPSAAESSGDAFDLA